MSDQERNPPTAAGRTRHRSAQVHQKRNLTPRNRPSLWRRVAAAIWAAAAAVSGIAADSTVVAGSMRYRFAVSSANAELLDAFVEYENESNRQTVVERTEGRIVVETEAKLAPFVSTVPYPPDDRYADRPDLARYLALVTRQSGITVTTQNGVRSEEPYVRENPVSDAGVRLLRAWAEEVVGEATTQREAVDRVVLALREEVRYVLNASNDPVDVYRSKRGDCDGYSNTAAIMLRSLGIPAKVVESWIPPGHGWGYGPGGSGGFHAHVEVYFDDAGWVSYDALAGLHFVDPYHIVGFPRRGVTFEELEVHDDRQIVGIDPRPEGNVSFMRRSVEVERLDPIFIGRITDSAGELLRDSTRTGDWVYLRNDGGGGRGVLILPSGDFAVTRELLGEDGVGVIYHGDDPVTYFEHRVDLREAPDNRVVRRDFDLREEDAVVLSIPADLRQVYRIHEHELGRVSLETLNTTPGGSYRIVSNLDRWVIATSSNLADPAYVLSPLRTPRGAAGPVALRDLPPFLQPGAAYWAFDYDAGIAPQSLTVVFLDPRGRRFQPTGFDPSFPTRLPEGRFDRVVMYNAERLYFGGLGAANETDGATVYRLGFSSFTEHQLVSTPTGRPDLLLLEPNGAQWRILARIRRPVDPYSIFYRSGEESTAAAALVLFDGERTPTPIPEAGATVQ